MGVKDINIFSEIYHKHLQIYFLIYVFKYQSNFLSRLSSV